MRARDARRFAICSGSSGSLGGSGGAASFGVSAIGPIKPSTRPAGPSPGPYRSPSRTAEGVEEQPEARERPEMPEAGARQVIPGLDALRLGRGEGLAEEAVDLPGAREALAGGRERTFGSGRIPHFADEVAQLPRLFVHLLPKDGGVEEEAVSFGRRLSVLPFAQDPEGRPHLPGLEPGSVRGHAGRRLRPNEIHAREKPAGRLGRDAIRLGAPGDPRARVPADRQGRGAFRQGLPFPAAATGGRIRAHVELLRGRGIEVREKLVEGFLQPFDVARAHPAPAARLLELVLVLAEALEILAELGAHEARVLLEVLFLLEDLARRRQNALLLLLVEKLELLLHRDIRRQDRLHDLGVVKGPAHPVLQRADVLEIGRA